MVAARCRLPSLATPQPLHDDHPHRFMCLLGFCTTCLTKTFQRHPACSRGHNFNSISSGTVYAKEDRTTLEMATVTTSRTILGPLTDVFNRPSSCSVILSVPGSSRGWQAQLCTKNGRAGDIGNDISCWPPRTTGAPTPTFPLYGWGAYSPGLSCPAGYTRACSATAGDAREFSFQFTLETLETAAGCCPFGYDCYLSPWSSSFVQTCSSQPLSGSFVAGTCNSLLSPVTSLQTVSAEDGSVKTANATASSTVAGLTLYAPMIQLIWRSEDIFPSSTSSATSESSEIASGGHISNGAAAGIGAGVAIFAIAMISAAVWFCLRRRRSRGQTRSKEGLTFAGDQSEPVEASACYQSHPQGFVVAGPPTELDVERKPQELDAGRKPQEMDGRASQYGDHVRQPLSVGRQDEPVELSSH